MPTISDTYLEINCELRERLHNRCILRICFSVTMNGRKILFKRETILLYKEVITTTILDSPKVDRQ